MVASRELCDLENIGKTPIVLLCIFLKFSCFIPMTHYLLNFFLIKKIKMSTKIRVQYLNLQEASMVGLPSLLESEGLPKISVLILECYVPSRVDQVFTCSLYTPEY